MTGGTLGRTGVEYHEAVCVVFTAKLHDTRRFTVLMNVATTAVQDDEVVSGTGEKV